MKRRLIKQGGGGTTVYLPKKWVEEKGLKPGEEIEIQRTDRGLLLTSDTKPERKEAVLNIPFNEKGFLDYILATNYRAGYDVLILKGGITPKDIEDSLRNLIGMEVASSKEGEVVLEIFAEPFEDKADKLLKQIFFIIKDDIKHVIEAVVNKGRPDYNRINLNSRRVMRNSNLCTRAMSKKLLAIEGFYWIVAEQLHWIERQIYYMASVLKDEKPAKLNDRQIAYMKSVQKSFDDLYDGIYKRSLASLNNVHKEFMKYEEEKYTLMKGPSMYAIKTMNHFITIYRFLLYTTSSATGMVSKEEK